MIHLLGEARLGCGALRNCPGIAVECKEDRATDEERRKTFDVKTRHSFDLSYEESAAVKASIGQFDDPTMKKALRSEEGWAFQGNCKQGILRYAKLKWRKFCLLLAEIAKSFLKMLTDSASLSVEWKLWMSRMHLSSYYYDYGGNMGLWDLRIQIAYPSHMTGNTVLISGIQTTFHALQQHRSNDRLLGTGAILAKQTSHLITYSASA